MDELYAPSELYITIIGHLTQPDIYSLANTSKPWNEFINSHSLLNQRISFKKVSSNLLSYIKDLIPRKKICKMSFKTGNLEVLKWSRKVSRNTDIFYDKLYKYNILEAVKNGHLGIIKWAHKHGCCYWDSNVTSFAAEYGHLEILKWAYENGCEIDLWYICAFASRLGHLEILKWAHENDCIDWGCDICSYAANGNHFEILKWAREHGCAWDEKTFAIAAYNNNLEMLKWLRAHNCPWDKNACINAANLDMLKWLRANNCPWNKRVLIRALARENLEMVRWAYENGCPFDDDVYNYFSEYSTNPEIIQWVCNTIRN